MRTGGGDSRRRATGILATVFCLWCFAGCATVRKAPPSAPAAPSPVVAPVRAPQPQTAPPGAPPPAVPQVSPPPVSPVTPPSTPPETAPPVSALTMVVESVPPGAVIVVDGRPVGKAPVRIAVPDTPQGFFRDYMEIRARFVATDQIGGSRTIMEEFTPREKVPAVLQFTPDGVQRTVR